MATKATKRGKGKPAKKRGERKAPAASAPAMSAAKELMTGPQLAVALDVHEDTIRKWAQDGMPVARRGKGRRASWYDVDEVQAWKRTRERASAVAAVAAEKVQNLRVERELKQIEKAKRLGQLVPVEEVERRWAGIVAAVRERILSLPGTALQQNIITADKEDALIALCDEALTDLAARGSMQTKGAA